MDLDLADFRHIVDFLRVRHDIELRRHGEATSGERVAGVRINCLGDQKVHGWPEYEVASTSAGIFAGAAGLDTTPPVLKKLELLIMMANISKCLSWEGRRFKGPFWESAIGRLLV